MTFRKDCPGDNRGDENMKSDASNDTKTTALKEYSQLMRFIAGASQNRFEAERLGDHCLHTTVSDLQKRYAIRFCRVREKVPTRFGRPVSVCRYWLDDENREKARIAVRYAP